MDFKTFLENFDVIAEAPGGIPKLRSLILDLAVRGKLVAQNPEDEPGDELFKKIQESREVLYSKKKASRKKDFLPFNCDEIPFSIPRTWKWARLHELCWLITDGTHHTPTYVESGIPFLSVKNVSGGYLDFSNTRFVTREAHEELCARCKPEYGDILLTKVGTTGIAVEIDIAQEFSIFVSIALLKHFPTFTYPKFLTHLLNSSFVKAQSKAGTEGVGNKNLVLRKIYNFVVPLPPLAEQKRIVEKVDELMALCDRYEAAKQTRDNLRQKLRGSAITSLMNAETDEELDAAWAFFRDNWQNLSQQPEDVDGLRQSILQLAVEGKLLPQEPSDDSASLLLEKINFSRRLKWEKKQLEEFSKKGKRPNNETWKAKYPEPDSLDVNDLPNIPESWEWCSLSSIAEHIVDGTHHTPTYVDNGIPFISAKDIINGQINFESCRMIPETEYMALSQRCNPQIDNLLVTKSGTIGRVAIVKTGKKFTLFESVALVPLLDLVEPDYIAHVAYLSCSGEFGKTNQKGMAVRHLHLKELRQLPIPLPPLAEQKRIVAKVDELMQLCDQLEANLHQSQQRAESFAASAINHLTI